ncbi:hypothetical protein BDF20DRAFT_814507 [Mycotypha africana]|uniref:uncharacterized protein n=1 Tax=Mycotypha africana TaxID=64632 RepID=UPI002300BEFC|nr:uncharacterized protein BDF20DRAFT_814507 [Mycotypha africana]KAI8988497.1 hypothetical protein BDF20DRAFT_814507 [Mycotypha africana]
MVGKRLSELSEAEKTVGVLLAINTVIFGLWQVPRLVPFMQRWFTHLPGGRGGINANITMVTSCFSHQTLMHYVFNMIGLWSFGTSVHEYLGREQFLATYLTFGVGASLISHVCQLPTRMTRLIVPSLGASGALYGIVAAYSVIRPDAAIALIFLPMVPIKLGTALPCMMAIDFLGILKRWSNFDHFAHLGGAFLGLGYAFFGQQYIWEPLLKNVNNARRAIKGWQ